MSDQTPTTRRRHDQTNHDLLVSITQTHQSSLDHDHNKSEADDSKNRRSLYFQLGPIVLSGTALDRLRARFVNFTSRLTLDTLRPLPLFLGMSQSSGPSFCFSAEAFSPPISLHQSLERVSRNLSFFATNYFWVTLCTFIIVSLMHVRMLALVCVTYVAWWLHLTVIKQDVKLFVMGKDFNRILTPRIRANVLMLWTLWVGTARCLKPSMKGLSISCVLILCHALLRDPSALATDIVTSHSRSAKLMGGSDSDESEVLVERPPVDV